MNSSRKKLDVNKQPGRNESEMMAEEKPVSNKIPQSDTVDVEVKVNDTKQAVAEKKPSKQNFARYSFAVLLIIFGLILLLNNIGLLPWEIWDQIWRLWPVLWVVLGLYWLLGKSVWMKILMTIIIVLLMGYILTVSLLSVSIRSVNDLFSVVIDKLPAVFVQQKDDLIQRETDFIKAGDFNLSSIEKVSVDLDIRSGKLTMSDKRSDESILQLDSEYYKNRISPSLEGSLNRNTLEIEFKSENQVAMPLIGVKSPKYDITLGMTEMTHDIFLAVDSGSAKIDFDQIKLGDFSADISSGSIDFKLGQVEALSGLKINVGSGSAELDLSEVNMSMEDIEIQVRSGTAKVYIPKGVGYQIKYNVASGIMKVDGISLVDEGTYLSENYGDSDLSLAINISVRSGLVTIEQ